MVVVPQSCGAASLQEPDIRLPALTAPCLLWGLGGWPAAFLRRPGSAQQSRTGREANTHKARASIPGAENSSGTCQGDIGQDVCLIPSAGLWVVGSWGISTQLCPMKHEES